MQLVDEAMMLKIREMYAGEKVHKATGGSAANTIYALANLGAATGFIDNPSNPGLKRCNWHSGLSGFVRLSDG